jgi:hypothetical protein
MECGRAGRDLRLYLVNIEIAIFPRIKREMGSPAVGFLAASTYQIFTR